MPVFATVGFPRMMKEHGEKRVFLPNFIQLIANLGVTVSIEEGYGSRSGYLFDDYKLGNEAVHMCGHEEAYQQDIVIVLRSPSPKEFELIRSGAVLISMLHFPTRPRRVERLIDGGIKAISLDSIVNSQNIRLVENMRAVAWNGLEVAFDVLSGRWPELKRPDGQPIRVLILGAGMVGKHAVEAATKLGNIERNTEHIAAGGPGALAMTIGRNISGNSELMETLMKEADILVDATQRRDPSKPVIPNDWIDWLPEHAVIADLSVDPYLLDDHPPVVRGIEGIPQGNLNQYIFSPTDPGWDKTVPATIPSQHRRTVVSCYSWPGIHPQACMEHYGRQIEPLIEVLLEKGYDDLALSGGYFERALCRGTLKEWLHSGSYTPHSR
ncbi:MAG: alanine dehydrogenase [Anaerolineae bacterium]|nr:alanine dehydrogenase [Anaerolineae bacterium]